VQQAPAVMPQGYSTQPGMVPAYQQTGNYNSQPVDGTTSNPLATALNKAMELLARPVFPQSSQPQSLQQGPQSSPSPTQAQPLPQFQGQPMGVPLPSTGSQTSYASPASYNNSSRPLQVSRSEFPLSGVTRTDASYPSEGELQAAGYTREGLNQFACELEQALMQMATVAETAERGEAAVRKVMTDPNILANYVMDFYGPNGPYPVQEAQQQLAMEQNYNYRQPVSYDPRVQADGAGLDSTTSRLVNPIGYQRPEFPAPPQAAPGQAGDIQMLSMAMQQDPSNAWQIIDYLQNNGAFRGTVLAMES